MYPHLLLTISLANEVEWLNDAGLLSGDAPHFRRKALTAPPPPPAPMEDWLDRLTKHNRHHECDTLCVVAFWGGSESRRVSTSEKEIERERKECAKNQTNLDFYTLLLPLHQTQQLNPYTHTMYEGEASICRSILLATKEAKIRDTVHGNSREMHQRKIRNRNSFILAVTLHRRTDLPPIDTIASFLLASRS